MLVRSHLHRFVQPLAVTGLAVWIAAAPEPACAARLLGDGAVVDSARGIVYLAQPQSGIEALDLSTGKAVWRSAAAAKPLALLEGGVLLAQDEPGSDGSLRAATLDVASGREKVRTEIALPAGLTATITDSLRGTFRVRAAEVDGGVVLAWTATAAPPLRGKLLRTPGGTSAPAARVGGFLRGAVRFDPATGKATSVVDSEVVGLAAAIDRSLSSDVATQGSTSIDGRHLLSSKRIAGSPTYRWSISDRATGSVLALLDVPTPSAPFVVVGPKVIYLAQPSMRRETSTVRQPLRLRALDLATGAEAWQAVVRDSAYRGPISR